MDGVVRTFGIDYVGDSTELWNAYAETLLANRIAEEGYREVRREMKTVDYEGKILTRIDVICEEIT